MKFHSMMAAGVAAILSLPVAAQAQGVVRGAEEGAAAGNRAAGPVGGAVGAGVGGVVGGIEGGIEGVLEFRSDAVRPTSATARNAPNLPQIRSPMTSLRAPPVSRLTCA